MTYMTASAPKFNLRNEPSSPSSSPTLIARWSPMIIWSMAAFFYLYEYVLRVSFSVMTTPLIQDFGITSSALGFLASLYYYGYTPLQIPCGVIVDRFGARRTVTVSAALCTAGCIFFSLSQNLLMAQMGRMLMGAGSACAYIATAKIAADWFRPKRFALLTSITMGLGLVGATFGAQPFAVLVNLYGWRMSMMVMAVIGVGVIILSWMILRDRKHPVSSQHTLNTSQKTSLLEGLKIITSNPQCWLIGVYGCFMLLPLSAFAELWGVPYLMQLYNVGNETASFATIMVFIGMALGCPLAAGLSDRLQSRCKVMRGSAILTASLFCIVVYGPTLPFTMTCMILFCTGLCAGGQILYFAAVKELNPPHISATTVGFTNTLVMTSALIFQPLLGLILDYVWDGARAMDGTPLYTLSAYKMALLPVPVCLIIAGFIIYYVRESYSVEQDEEGS